MSRKQFVASLAVGLITAITSATASADHFNGHVNVTVGQLSDRAALGRDVFNAQCGKCHGTDGEGTRKGPPLIHDIYNPGHHGNKAFYQAVRKGVTQHHWPYGDMPAQQQVGFSEMAALVQFIREVQKQNGVVYRAHRM